MSCFVASFVSKVVAGNLRFVRRSRTDVEAVSPG